MSRFLERDYDGSTEQVLARGRWLANARKALKGKRGRQALGDLRDALLALPEHRLIFGAMCTVGGVDKRLPQLGPDADEFQRRDRDTDRAFLAERIEEDGEGVCAVGAYLWHRKVKEGMDPAEAFDALPVLLDNSVEDADDGDALAATAHLGQQAGLTFTLAWELAFRNDEKYQIFTPEDRYTKFLAWIDRELAEEAS